MRQSAEMARRLQQDLQRRNIRLVFFDSFVDPGFMAEAKTYRLPFINLKAELDREQGDFFGTMPIPAGGETGKSPPASAIS